MIRKKILHQRIRSWILLACLAFWNVPVSSRARAAETIQEIPLSYGWNAVWLEVEPVDSAGNVKRADEIFRADPLAPYTIDIIAVEIRQLGTEEFGTNPAQLTNQKGWEIWNANASSGETQVVFAEANRAYYVHVINKDGNAGSGLADTLQIFGKVRYWEPIWKAGHYNFIGFHVSGRPTFRGLLASMGFSGDTTTAGSPIQELDAVTGEWNGISPDSLIQSSKAYRVHVPFALSSYRFNSPIRVDFPGRALGTIAVGNKGTRVPVPKPGSPGESLWLSPLEFTFTSLEPAGASSHEVSISLMSPDPVSATAQELQLFPLERVPNELAWQVKGNGPLNQDVSLAIIEPNQSVTVLLGVNRNWTTGSDYRENLYRIEVSLPGGSCYQYLPISARNEDVAPMNPDGSVPADPSLAGLWFGSIAVDAVTSLTEEGRPLRPTSTTAPLKMLLHVDESGQVNLLSRVMLMQTKTADRSVQPQEVLVLDEAQIPFFQGIQTRAGKKVGIRYETAFFDMPRLYGTNAQSVNFLESVASAIGATTGAAGQLTDQQVEDYLAAQTTRPVGLNEAYALQFPLSGSFLPGQSVGTSMDAPLRLDAFHRSNPFRHAFHPQHGAGYTIRRSFSVTLDGQYRAGSGVLTGVYQESAYGLASNPIVSRGRITLQRLSTTTAIQ